MADQITPPTASENKNSAQAATGEQASVDRRLVEVRSRISDLGFELDAAKASAGLAMGAGVFLILLAGLASYDLFSGKAGIWMTVGITREMLYWVAYGCGAIGAALIIQTIVRRLRRDRSTEEELAGLEEEYAQLLDANNSTEAEIKKRGA